MNKPKISVSVKPAEQWKARVYFFIEDESILENLANRGCRPYAEYRKILPTVLAAAGLRDPDGEVAKAARWSRKAGCSCGCSPGFIIDHSAMRNRNVFVTIK